MRGVLKRVGLIKDIDDIFYISRMNSRENIDIVSEFRCFLLTYLVGDENNQPRHQPRTISTEELRSFKSSGRRTEMRLFLFIID